MLPPSVERAADLPLRAAARCPARASDWESSDISVLGILGSAWDRLTTQTTGSTCIARAGLRFRLPGSLVRRAPKAIDACPQRLDPCQSQAHPPAPIHRSTRKAGLLRLIRVVQADVWAGTARLKRRPSEPSRLPGHARWSTSPTYRTCRRCSTRNAATSADRCYSCARSSRSSASRSGGRNYDQIDHVPTQVVTEYLLRIFGDGKSDSGLLYPSALTGAVCIVLDVPHERCVNPATAWTTPASHSDSCLTPSILNRCPAPRRHPGSWAPVHPVRGGPPARGQLYQGPSAS
jgi:hypothetical protein